MRIALTGASGLIGHELSSLLRGEGHETIALVRHRTQAENEVYWDPAVRLIDSAPLAGVNAVIHLAGENIAGGRWTPARKLAIRNSRVDGTRLLCETVATLPKPPAVLIAASAVGYYGNRGTEVVTEDSPPGSGFLADVTSAWESATQPAREAGIRVVNLRIGVVLSSKGGALARMMTPFRLGLGGVLGSGDQMMSWIALEDVVRAIAHALSSSSLAGAVNAVAPGAVTNREFTKTLGRILARPTLFPVPAGVVRILFGEMGVELLLAGANVKPTRLQTSGFTFIHPDLESALRATLVAA